MFERMKLGNKIVAGFAAVTLIAAVMGSEKKMGSTRSTISPETSRKFRLLSKGTSARRAPLSMPTWSGSARDRKDLMLPWILRSPRINSPAKTD